MPFPLRSGKQECPFLSLQFDIVQEVIASAKKQERNKRPTDWEGRKEVFFKNVCIVFHLYLSPFPPIILLCPTHPPKNLSLLIGRYDHLCVKHTESTKKLLELMSDISKIAGYNIKILHLVAFLYTNNNP